MDESSFHSPWERQKIDEFIIKLGFLEDDDQRVQEFQRNNEVQSTLYQIFRLTGTKHSKIDNNAL